MFAILTIHTLILLLAIVSTPPSLVGAVVTLLRPDPGEKVKAGASCLVQWKGDTDSKTIWKKMSIQLMTGDNYNMVFLKTVATNQDGTSDGQFKYTCPYVTPYSDIYFYQLASSVASNKTWTARFTIASSTGASVAPSNATQPDGAAIPWGTGALKGSTKAVASPKVESSSTGWLPSSSSTSLSNASASAASSADAGSIKAESWGKATLVSLSMLAMALMLSL